MKLEKVAIDKLIFPEYNPRKKLKEGDLEYEKIKASIEKFGYVDPVIVNKDNTIIGGNQRAAVLKDLGRKIIEVVRLDLSKDEEKTLNITLNKVTGEWDFNKLSVMLDDLKKQENDLFKISGFDDKEFDKIMKSFDQEKKTEAVEEDDFDEKKAKEVIVEPVSRPGDLFKLGDHLLLCGDCCRKEDREKIIEGKEIDMIFTDPPYNMNMSGGNGCFTEKSLKLRKSIEHLVDFDVNTIEFVKELNIKTLYFFTSKDCLKNYLNLFEKYKFNLLVWCKTNPIPFTNNTFIPDIEYLLYFGKEKRIWNNNLKPFEIYKKYYVSSIQYARKVDGDLHPTMKPLELINNRILISSNKGGYVLDLFGGSGSTMIAAEKTERKCLTIEIDRGYCDVMIKRYINLKGSDDKVFLLTAEGKEIPWKDISKYRPVRGG